jgi:hypothetical protein
VFLKLATCGVNVFGVQLIEWNHKISRVICSAVVISHFLSAAVEPELYIAAACLLHKLQHILLKVLNDSAVFARC